jgi:hypothetical protein
MTPRDYVIVGVVVLVGWFLISRPLSRQEAARHRGARFRASIVSLAIAGACIWFAWWVLATRCHGGC